MVNVGASFAGKIPASGLELGLKEKAQELPISVRRQPSDLAVTDAAEKKVTDDSNRNKDVSDLVQAVDTVNQKLLVKSTNLVFEFDDVQDPPIVKVVDKHNGDVIREIPSKELREIAKALNSIADNLNGSAGILVDEQL
ncbi:flagellar protein FlaG [Rheinheimera marina]|uniref:Flagellar protein FlaG n=1 Tax=Rheinheimera marina TaxID=1774958 RepID=A0ABV9JRS8_9GAMM